MVNADVEIGVVPNVCRQMHRAVGGLVQAWLHPALLRAALSQQLRQPHAQRPPRACPERQEWIENGAGRRFCGRGGLTLEETRSQSCW